MDIRLASACGFQKMQDNRGNRVSLRHGKLFSSISDLINGKSASTVQITQIATPLGFREWLGAWYVSDTMRLRPALTVTAGLRHELYERLWRTGLQDIKLRSRPDRDVLPTQPCHWV